MPTQTTSHVPRRRERPAERAHLRGTDELPNRISKVREQVFELVSELRRDQATRPVGDLDRADQMQSIANQLGAIEAALSAQNT